MFAPATFLSFGTPPPTGVIHNSHSDEVHAPMKMTRGAMVLTPRAPRKVSIDGWEGGSDWIRKVELKGYDQLIIA